MDFFSSTIADAVSGNPTTILGSAVFAGLSWLIGKAIHRFTKNQSIQSAVNTENLVRSLSIGAIASVVELAAQKKALIGASQEFTVNDQVRLAATIVADRLKYAGVDVSASHVAETISAVNATTKGIGFTGEKVVSFSDIISGVDKNN
jgi:hypothetical protein